MHTVGFPAIDLIAAGQFAKLEEIGERLSLDVNRPIVLFTQHSVTSEFDQAADQVAPSLEAFTASCHSGCASDRHISQ